MGGVTLRSRRWLLSLVLITALLMTACGGGGASPGSEGEQGDRSDPIVIGALLTNSGPFASLGENIYRGMDIYFKEIGYKVAGREIKVVVEDDQGDPQQGLAKTRKLVEQDEVDILTGVVLSPVADAIRDYVHNRKVPLVISNAGIPSITQDPNRRSPYIFRVSCINGQYETALGTYAYEELGYRRMAVTALDYSAGHDKAGAFKKFFEAAGGQVVNEVYAPQGTNDFAPYIQRLQQVPVDAVFAFYSGTDAIRFVQQYMQSPLGKSTPLIGSGDMLDEGYINEIGDAALGMITVLHYSPFNETEANKKFVQAFQEAYGILPGQYAYEGYISAAVIAEALKAVDGQVEDTERFLEALRNVEFEGPAGTFRFNPETQNVILTAFIRKLEKLPDGTYAHKVIAQYPNVDDQY